MEAQNKPPIAFILDDQLSNDKAGVLTHTIRAIGKYFDVELIPGHSISENEIIQKWDAQKYQLVLVPLNKYRTWIRFEGVLGINRTSGPTFAGYFCEPIPHYQLPEIVGHQRRILLDFVHLTAPELLILIRSLIVDTSRSGLKPLLKNDATLYCETWYGGQGLGNRIDAILRLKEIANPAWIKRSNAIRIILTAFWSLIYEEGPGKSEKSPSVSIAVKPKAYFQLGADDKTAVFRLHYSNFPHLTAKEALEKFWPNRTSPTSPSQLLLRYCDFVRFHTIPETTELEVVVGLFHSAPSEKFPEEAHTLWIEPLSSQVISETPYEAPGPSAPHLRALPNVSWDQAKPRAVDSPEEEDSDPGKDRALLLASTKIKELRDRLTQQTETIRELKSGGVGGEHPMPSPDAESLLEAFQQRYFEAKYEIRQFELQIEDMKQRGSNPKKIETLRLKMEALANRERAWIRKLMTTLQMFRERPRRPKGNR